MTDLASVEINQLEDYELTPLEKDKLLGDITCGPREGPLQERAARYRGRTLRAPHQEPGR